MGQRFCAIHTQRSKTLIANDVQFHQEKLGSSHIAAKVAYSSQFIL